MDANREPVFKWCVCNELTLLPLNIGGFERSLDTADLGQELQLMFVFLGDLKEVWILQI